MAADFIFDKQETIDRLEQSLATVESFLPLVPERWTHEPPEAGAWSVAMNLAHLVVYEEGIAAPMMESFGAGGDGTGSVRSTSEGWFLQDALDIAVQPLGVLAARLRAARQRQIDVVRGMTDGALNKPVVMAFSARSGGTPHPASWVATKTFQHTWEHGNAILRVALFTPRV